jgi:hypothetical protein
MNHLNFAQEVNQRMEVLLREQGRLIGYVRRDNETGEEEFFLFESPKEPTSQEPSPWRYVVTGCVLWKWAD